MWGLDREFISDISDGSRAMGSMDSCLVPYRIVSREKGFSLKGSRDGTRNADSIRWLN